MYNVVSTLAPSFLIGPSSSLQVTRTAIKSWMGLKCGKIGPEFVEFAALERLEKIPCTYNGRNVVTTLAPSFFAGDKDNNKSLHGYEFLQDLIADHGVSCPLASRKSLYNVVTTLALSFLIQTLRCAEAVIGDYNGRC